MILILEEGERELGVIIFNAIKKFLIAFLVLY